jgi:hypothetical protein
LDLWSIYHGALESYLGDAPQLVIHSAALFHDPAAELSRLTEFTGLHVTPDQVAAAAQAVRRNYVPTRVHDEEAISEPTAALYESLCSKAGPIFQMVMQTESKDRLGQRSISDKDLFKAFDRRARDVMELRGKLADLEAEREDLRQEIARIVGTRWYQLGERLRRRK